MTYPSRTAERIIIRLPDGMRRELKILAAQKNRTMTGQVVTMLESGLAAEKAASNPTA